jgi:tellurite methyltransferase
LPRDWDQRYSELTNIDLTPAPLLVEVADHLPPGDALDLACGLGRNALHLARLGWRVTAVDSSAIAIRRLRASAAGLAVDARLADLAAGDFLIAPAAYDLICDFLYLERSVFPSIREGVRPGGVFAGEMLLRRDAADQAHHNPAWLLETGELRSLFTGWKIIYYSEAPKPGKRSTARIIARRA